MVCLCPLLSRAVSGPPRPNIVYFFADDLGWAEIGANMDLAEAAGMDMTEARKIITPHIDALVEGGINFTHAYGNPVCSPSRSCQQTGFHQGHTWADRNDTAADKSMRTQDPTIGKLLAVAGYRNGMYGKWGYGASSSQTSPVIVNEQTLPEHHGYHDCLVELHHVRAHTYNQPSLWRSFIDDDGTLMTDTTLVPNGDIYPSLQYSTGNYWIDDLYAEATKDFIKTEIVKQQQAADPKPFFAQVSFQVPHTPFNEISGTVDGWFDAYASTDTASWNDTEKYYAAMITHMDQSIGEIMNVLEDPNQDGNTSDSILTNTLVVFASDNGGSSQAPDLFNVNGHLRGYKTSVHEGGIRDPLVFYWEGVIAPGQTTDYKTCITDIFPTFCELAGVDSPVGVDGTSIAPLLTGNGTIRTRPYFCYEDHNSAAWDWSVIKDGYKLTKGSDGTLYLYDLDAHEDESTNLTDAAYMSIRDEIYAIAVAESLDEGDLFANCFPTWIGGDGADINAAGSWQDTGSRDLGELWPYGDTPQSYWNAVVENPAQTNRTALLNESIETLGFEIAGATNGALLEVTLAPGVSIDGRNEVRISDNASLLLRGGSLSSMRFLDIRKGAALEGFGVIDANLYQAGVLNIAATGSTISVTNIIPGSAIAGTELIQNGGFENGTPDADSDYSYALLDNWTTDGADPSGNDGAIDGNTHSGTYRGLVSGGYNLLQDCAHLIEEDESYHLDFWHIAKLRWDVGVDQFEAELFYMDGGLRQTLFSETITPAASWNNRVVDIGPVTDPNAVGKNLFLTFTPDGAVANNEFASIDDVSLSILTAGNRPAVTNVTTTTTYGMAVSNDYTALSSGRIHLELNGTSTNQYSRLIVGGHAELAGRLIVALAEGFTPEIGDTFEVISADSVAGQFEHINNRVNGANGSQFLIHYHAGSVVLEAVEPIPLFAPIYGYSINPSSNYLQVAWASSAAVPYRLAACTNLVSAGENPLEWITVTGGLYGAEAGMLQNATDQDMENFTTRFYSVQEE